MQNETFSRYDTADYLKTKRQINAYLEAVADEAGDDPSFVVAALETIARARNKSALARDSGLTRKGLYKALSTRSNPSFATVAKLAQALGLKISLKAA